MATREIISENDPLLKKTSKTVTEFNPKLWTLLEDMAQTMHENNGVGLAAVQVGILRRVAVIDIGDGVIELINPEILRSSRKVSAKPEGCLSSPGEFGIVERPLMVRIKAYDRNGNEITLRGEDLLARAFCHEIDHTNGITFKDIMIRVATDEEING